MSDTPRYQTLRDYLRVIRAQRWLIVLIVVVFGGAAYAYSSSQEEKYQAEASLSFKDPTQDLSIIGIGSIPQSSPEQRAAINSELVTRVEVARRVQKELGTSESPESLQHAVSARPEARTNLVVITATASTAEGAAALANAFATEAAAVGNEEVDRQFAKAERSVRRAYREARKQRASVLALSTLLDRLSRVEGLRDFGRTVQITRRAEVPSSPSSPTPGRDTALGVLLGLVVALLAAFARDSLDVRLRGAREIQAHVKVPLVGHVDDEALGRSAIGRNGHRQLDVAALEAFRILRKNVEFLDVDRPLRVVAVTSPLAEEGKSTVAASLAWAYAQSGKRTLLVECDLRRPSLADRLGLRASPGLTDYLAEKAEPQQVLQGLALEQTGTDRNGSANGADAGPAVPELVVITAGSPVPRPSDILASKRFKDFLVQVRDAYDVVVLDTSPLLSVSDTLELVPHVDGIVLCVRAGRTRREEAKAAKAALEHLPQKPTGLVVTGIKHGDEADYGYYSSAYVYGMKRG
jgi:succinoglycan biosynthesis transport protein ExoP